ncbi:hypothetical protein BDY19DRAFT_986757 [Irpex rosettiformis]|uniref:Uncharacterized protein n=1 Tax=Irpex rosettiformis TaxID=378272 RepID=A0ACB8TW36_9APHY|nr:hypothetical protein BDY19DRAFT_986757 [Irpex rosettiformis]
MLVEANCIYWGGALMRLVYDFMENFKNNLPPASAASCPSIPDLRFVHCGVAVPSSNKEGPIYLLEERIDDKFVKYILNNSLSPVPHLTGRDLKIALFLCFSQHVQYLDTQENLFLSDFQGGGPLLTDPQVITASKYSTKFAAGNISSVLESFKQLHKCNYYCQWFGLTPYGDSTDVRETVPRSVESDMDLGTQSTST